jgi:hypothetical protein
MGTATVARARARGGASATTTRVAGGAACFEACERREREELAAVRCDEEKLWGRGPDAGELAAVAIAGGWPICLRERERRGWKEKS